MEKWGALLFLSLYFKRIQKFIHILIQALFRYSIYLQCIKSVTSQYHP